MYNDHTIQMALPCLKSQLFLSLLFLARCSNTAAVNLSLSLHFTALRTLLSRGFLLGSLVEDRIPVPQLLASVFLQERERNADPYALDFR